MNKKVLVAGIAVTALVAGGLYFAPGDGGQGFVFRLPEGYVPPAERILDKPNLNFDAVGNKNMRVRDGVMYEGQAGPSADRDDAAPLRQPSINSNQRNDFSINPDVFYEGDGSKRKPSTTESSFGPSSVGGKQAPSPLGLGQSSPSPSTPSSEVGDNGGDNGVVDDVQSGREAHQATVMENMESFRTLAWGYQSGVEAIRRNACIDPVNGAALRIMANDIATSAEHMNELMGYVARGSIMYRDGIGTDINDAKRYLEGFGAVLEVVHEDCVSGAQKAALFPEAYYDDVNYGRTLGEVKDSYEYMMNNGLY